MEYHFDSFEKENKHLFKDTTEYNFWDGDNFSYTSDELNFYNDNMHHSEFNYLYGEKKENPKINQKSWLINLETRNPELIIRDIDDGEIPEILSEYVWVTELVIDHQEIKAIKNLPPNLKSLTLYNNKIKDIPGGMPPNGLEKLDISKNKIIKLENIPISIIELECEHNEIEICNLEHNINLEKLIIHSNKLTTFPILNSPRINKLDISYNYIVHLTSIPDSITELDISYNELTQFNINSPNLKKINCKGNKLKFITKYPPNIERMNFSKNEIVFIPVIPTSLKYAKFNNNNIKSIITIGSDGKSCVKSGKLLGNYMLELNNNPLNNVPDYILANPRLIHNKKININYHKIEHLKEIIL